MNTFNLKVYASDKIFYDGEAISIILPTVDGQMEILANHEDMIIGIKIGEIHIKGADEKWITAAVSYGFAKILDNEVSILVSTAERPEDIDKLRAEEAKEQAEEYLRQQHSIQEYHASKASLARAMNRLKASKDKDWNN